MELGSLSSHSKHPQSSHSKHAQSSHYMSSSNGDDKLASSRDEDGVSPETRITKPGLRRGRRVLNNKTNEDWFYLCETWIKLKEKRESLTYRQFLESEESGPIFEFNRSTKQSLIYYLKRYKSGTLRPEKVKRSKKRKFCAVEEKLLSYIQLRSQKNRKDTSGLSWLDLQKKCMEWKNNDPDLHDEPFSCSAGWLNGVLKRNGLTKIKNKQSDEGLPSTESVAPSVASHAEDDRNLNVSSNKESIGRAIMAKHQEPTVSSLCSILDSQRPEGFRRLRLLLLKSARSVNDESMVQVILESYSHYVRDGYEETQLAANLVEDYLTLLNDE